MTGTRLSLDRRKIKQPLDQPRAIKISQHACLTQIVTCPEGTLNLQRYRPFHFGFFGCVENQTGTAMHNARSDPSFRPQLSTPAFDPSFDPCDRLERPHREPQRGWTRKGASGSVNPLPLEAAWYRQFSGARKVARGGKKSRRRFLPMP